MFSFRFGEKSFTASFSRIYVHSAVVVDLADDDDFGVLWAREGIRILTENRDVITSAMPFTECSNYQSNLDEDLLVCIMI